MDDGRLHGRDAGYVHRLMDLGDDAFRKKGIAVPLFLYTKIDHLIYDFPLLLYRITGNSSTQFGQSMTVNHFDQKSSL